MRATRNSGIRFPSIDNFMNLPITSWEKFLNISPTFDIDLFSHNEEDKELEQRVLDEVGSYGKQIGRLMKMVRILLEECAARGVHFPVLDEAEIDKFMKMAAVRDAALGKPRREHGAENTERILRFIEDSRDHHPKDFERIARRCLELQGPAAQPQPATQQPA